MNATFKYYYFTISLSLITLMHSLAPPACASGPRLPVPELNARRRQAVALRLQGHTLAQAARASQLSVPTVVAAQRAWQQGGWEAVDVRPRGRKRRDARPYAGDDELAWLARWRDPAAGVWSLARAVEELRATHPALQAWAATPLEALVSRLWHREGLTPTNAWDAWRHTSGDAPAQALAHELPALRRAAARQGAQLLALSERTLPGWPGQRHCQLAAHNGRGSAWWQLTADWPTEADWIAFWSALRGEAGRPLWLLTDNRWLAQRPGLAAWLADATHGVTLLDPAAHSHAAAPPSP